MVVCSQRQRSRSSSRSRSRSRSKPKHPTNRALIRIHLKPYINTPLM